LRLAVRASSRLDNVEGLGAEIVTADMRDRAGLTKAMSGSRYLFHVAADYRLWAKDPSEIERNNLEGTRAVMQAAQAAGSSASSTPRRSPP
jgi:dihydroflavonol-4-reductase